VRPCLSRREKRRTEERGWRPPHFLSPFPHLVYARTSSARPGRTWPVSPHLIRPSSWRVRWDAWAARRESKEEVVMRASARKRYYASGPALLSLFTSPFAPVTSLQANSCSSVNSPNETMATSLARATTGVPAARASTRQAGSRSVNVAPRAPALAALAPRGAAPALRGGARPVAAAPRCVVS